MVKIERLDNNGNKVVFENEGNYNTNEAIELLGKQASFAPEITDFGFKTVNTSVMAFNLTDISAINKTYTLF